MYLDILRPQGLLEYYATRWNETKLGETVKTLPGGLFNAQTLLEARQAGARYALVGVPEDIGPRANGGRAGCAAAWPAFLKYFLSQQSNCFLEGDNLLLVGSLHCEDLQEAALNVPPGREPLEYWRQLCAVLDERLFPIVAALVAYGFLPIVIGGGHNNAFPLIKGVAMGLSLSSLRGPLLEDHPLMQLAFGRGNSLLGEVPSSNQKPAPEVADHLAQALGKIASGEEKKSKAFTESICPEEMSLAEAVRRHLQEEGVSQEKVQALGPTDDGGQHFLPLAVVNCDPHGDFRALEGRHSGNPFSYAKMGRYLDTYCLLGYHENANSANMLAYMRAQGVRAFSYESIWVRREFSLEETLRFIIQLLHQAQYPVGVELDADALAQMPSSARTPCGLSLEEGAYYLYSVASALPIAYAHLPEAAPSLGEDGERYVGRGLTLLVNSILKGCQHYAEAGRV